MKMKKMAILLAAALVLGGCGGASSGAEGEDQMQKAAEEAFSFTVDGVTVVLNAQATPILEELGEELSYFESESCAFSGLDKEYTYSSFVITTYPVDEVDYVAGIVLMDDTVATEEGISIGSSLAEVIAAYGESDSQTTCEYESGDSRLLILLSDEVVTSIQYVAITE